MANTRFDGTIEFTESIKEPHRPIPFGIDTHFLHIHIKGKLKFDVIGLNGEVFIDHAEAFASHNSERNLHRIAVKRYEEGAVDRMIKRLIINAIKNFQHNQECDIAKEQYKELLSGVKKYGVELHLKPRDFEDR